MTSPALAKKYLVTGFALLAVAVLIGAFGAHGLKDLVTPEKLGTFETGVRYHFYHAFGIVIVGFTQLLFPSLKLNAPFFAFLVGVLLFSFNCYFYVISGLKIFAMIVPLGGILFVVGWTILAWKVLKFR